MNTRYTVEVEHEDGFWIAEVVGLTGAHTSARNLVTLRERIQEVIGLVLDRPEEERFEVDLVYVGEDEALSNAFSIGWERARLDQEQHKYAELTADSAQKLAAAGWSVRDIGGALQITPGRVSQILAVKRAS